MVAPVSNTTPPPPDTTPPTVSLTPPAPILAGTVNLAATASDNVGVAGVQFLLDGERWAPRTLPRPTAFPGTRRRQRMVGIRSWRARATLQAILRRRRQRSTSPSITSLRLARLLINAGAAATNSTAVMLSLTATDAVTSVTQMRFSNNGTSFSTAEATHRLRRGHYRPVPAPRLSMPNSRMQRAIGRLLQPTLSYLILPRQRFPGVPQRVLQAALPDHVDHQ